MTLFNAEGINQWSCKAINISIPREPVKYRSRFLHFLRRVFVSLWDRIDRFSVCLFPLLICLSADKAVWDARTRPVSIVATDAGQHVFHHARRQPQCLASHQWHDSWVNRMAEKDPSQTDTYDHQVSGMIYEFWLFHWMSYNVTGNLYSTSA